MMESTSLLSEDKPSATEGPGDFAFSVAMTLLSTEAGGFQEKDVAPVAATAALDFLSSPERSSSRFPQLRVVLTAEEGSTALEALRGHVTLLAEAREETRLVVKACSLPSVGEAGYSCAYLVNPCNWCLAAGGARTNVLVNRAAGDCLRQGSLEGGRKRAVVGEPIPVKLSVDSPLRAQGVDTVIQILGPNLDPRFPGCLTDQPKRAHDLLRQCYDRVLLSFWELALSATSGSGVDKCVAPATTSNHTSAATRGCTAAPPATAFAGKASAGEMTDCDVAAAVLGKAQSGTNRKRSFPEYRRDLPVPAKTSGYWKTALLKYVREQRGPRRPDLQNKVYYEDDQCLVIYDGYPKSRYHLLLLPKPKFLNVDEASALRGEHLSRLRQLHATGAAVAKALTEQGAGVVRCGYHGIPSLRPLHLHIISQDFDGIRMRKYSHWNSFTTDFFLESSWVEARLEELGSLELDTERLKHLEATPLRCFRCGRAMGNMTLLKNHNRGCTAPLPQRAAVGSGHSAGRRT